MKQKKTTDHGAGKAHNWRRIGVFLVVQLVLVVVLAEFALRLVAPRHENLRRLVIESASVERIEGCATLEELMETSLIGFRPYTLAYGYVLNSRSLRTSEYTEAKPAGVHRVLAFGDSFTWASGGLPHQQHWPTILEQELNTTSEAPVEVLRFGVPATGTAFQFRMWLLEGSRLQADTVVVAFFVGNDFLDHQTMMVDSDLQPTSWRPRVAKRSYLVRLVLNLRRALLGVEGGGGNRSAKDIGGDATGQQRGGYEIPGYERREKFKKPKLSMEKFFTIEKRRMALCLESKRPQFEEMLGHASTVLFRFRDEVEATGARFVVMIIPDEYQVSPAVAPEVLSRTGRSIDQYDLELPQRRLVEVLEGEGIEVLDLLRVFQQRGTTAELYGARDTHWNHDGNRLAAEELAAFLQAAE